MRVSVFICLYFIHNRSNVPVFIIVKHSAVSVCLFSVKTCAPPTSSRAIPTEWTASS